MYTYREGIGSLVSVQYVCVLWPLVLASFHCSQVDVLYHYYVQVYVADQLEVYQSYNMHIE